jgi:hypothetical protein
MRFESRPFSVEWNDYEFVQTELEQERATRQCAMMLTGWETVIFELEDEASEEDRSL